MRFVPLAARNLLANKRRLIRSSAGIGFAVLLMLVQLGFERGFFDASLAMVRHIDADLVIMSASKYRFGSADPLPPADLASAATVAGVAAVAPLYAGWQDFFWKDPKGDKVYLVQAFAFDPDRPVFRLPELKAQSARLKEEDSVIVDRRAQPVSRNGERGARYRNQRPHRAYRRQLRARPRFHGDGTVMMSPATFARLLPGNQTSAAALPVEFGIVKVHPDAHLASVQQALQACTRRMMSGF